MMSPNHFFPRCSPPSLAFETKEHQDAKKVYVYDIEDFNILVLLNFPLNKKSSFFVLSFASVFQPSLPEGKKHLNGWALYFPPILTHLVHHCPHPGGCSSKALGLALDLSLPFEFVAPNETITKALAFSFSLYDTATATKCPSLLSGENFYHKTFLARLPTPPLV